MMTDFFPVIEDISLGINGFGRIGRLLLRHATSLDSQIAVTVINDPGLTLEHAAYLLRNDTVHGRFPATVSTDESIRSLIINGHPIIFSSEKDPSKVPWNGAIVAECSGAFTSTAKCAAHLTGGASHVVISAPASDDITPTLVIGVNAHTFNGAKIVSNASCTTNCLAPLVNILDKRFGLIDGLMTTVHSMTSIQSVVDGPSRNWRTGRASLANIIPTSTGAASSIALVLPHLAGKLTGLAFRVPTLDVSVLDLSVRLERPPAGGIADIVRAVEEATSAHPGLHRIIGVTVSVAW